MLHQRGLPLGVLVIAIAGGCEIDGRTYPCTLDDSCDDHPTSGAGGGDPEPIGDVQATSSAASVAVHGTAKVVATSRSGAELRCAAPSQLAVDVLRAELGRLELEVSCDAAGSFTMSCESATGRATVNLSCSEATQLEASVAGVALPSEPDVFYVRGEARESERRVRLTLRDAIGRDLADDSFAIVPPTAPQLLVLPAHEILLPATPGTYDLVISTRALGQLPRPVRIVDHVDALVGERTAGTGGSGTVCFYGIEGGELVIGEHWNLTASGIETTFPSARNCITYRATAGAQPRVRVYFAGLTQQFDLDAL